MELINSLLGIGHTTDDMGVATDWLLEANDSIDEYGYFAGVHPNRFVDSLY